MQHHPMQQPQQPVMQQTPNVQPAPPTQPQTSQAKEFNIASLCRIGQETVQDIVSRTQEVFQTLRTIQVNLIEHFPIKSSLGLLFPLEFKLIQRKIKINFIRSFYSNASNS